MGIFYPISEGDPVYSRETELEFAGILREDNPEKFFKLLKDKKEEVVPNTYRNLLELCIEMRASKCTIAFLKAEFTHENKPLIDLRPQLLVHMAILWPDIQVLETMFNECDAHCLAQKFVRFHQYLPIHELLVDIMNEPPFSEWQPGDSLIKLIIMLIASPTKRRRLQCIGLIANNTYQIHKVALGLYHGGDVKELAALLLLSYQKAFPPVKSAFSKEAFDNMISRAVHGENPDVFGLVHLFDKAGESLTEFYNSIPPDFNLQAVIIEVARLVEKAGFPITYRDVDFADAYSFDPDMMDVIRKAVGVKLDDGMDYAEQPGFPSVYCMPPMIASGVPYRREDYMVFRNRRFPAKAYYQVPVRKYSTASQTHIITTTKQFWSSPSLRGVASLAMKIKRGIRVF